MNAAATRIVPQAVGLRQDDQPDEHGGHAGDERVGLGAAVGVEADDRLQQRADRPGT